MPLSNVELERLFSRMKRAKSKTRYHLSNGRLGNLLRIGKEPVTIDSCTSNDTLGQRETKKAKSVLITVKLMSNTFSLV